MKELDGEIEQLLKHIVKAKNQSVIGAYENRIAELETKKLLLEEKVSKPIDKTYLQRDFIELALNFLENPRKLWDSML